MKVTYEGLWLILADKQMNKTDLKNLAKVSSNVIAKLGKNEPVSIDTLTKICLSLDCNFGDIISLQKRRKVNG